MKKCIFFLLAFLGCFSVTEAQDYKVTKVVHNQNDMTARKTILTERLGGGEQCAVLRISTQNISDSDRDGFRFECDMGSTIRERRKDGGEILLWVSPGLRTLKLKHDVLGNYILTVADFMEDDIESLNTYTVTVVGERTTETVVASETVTQGSSGVVFRPVPEDAAIFINGDSLGIGQHDFRNFAGKYEWTLRHPLFREKTGVVELKKGVFDTLDIRMEPDYGFLQVSCDEVANGLSVYVDDVYVGKLPYESGRIAAGKHKVAFGSSGRIDYSHTVEVKEGMAVSESYSGAKEITYGLKRHPLYCSLRLNTTPSAASVFIDGVRVGTSPISIDTMKVGLHSFKVYKSLCTPAEFELLMQENDTVTKNVALVTACALSVTSDGENDVIYLDGELVGKAPVRTEISFGEHELVAERDNHRVEKHLIVTRLDTEMEVEMSFGQLVHVVADRNSSLLYVDGKVFGRTPMDVYLANGLHSLKATKAWRLGQDSLMISEENPITDYFILTKPESPADFAKHGVFFLTGNLSRDVENNRFFGVTIGSVVDMGWFLSFESGADYSPWGTKLEANGQGIYPNGINPGYTGETSLMRLSGLVGTIARVGGPVYLRMAVGYGMRTLAWKNDGGEWVKIKPGSWQEPEVSLGLQCSIYYFTFSADWQIPISFIGGDTNLYELKFGIGFDLNYRD